MRNRLLGMFFGLSIMALAAGAAIAQPRYDTPTFGVEDRGFFRITLSVTAGPSGTPSGYSVQWMKKTDFLGNGSVWPDEGDPRLKYCQCFGPYILNQWAGSAIMGGGETSWLQLGDLADEEPSAIYGNDYEQLSPNTEYVIRGYAEGDGSGDPSEFSSTITVSTTSAECTQGFWKTHGPGACHSGNNANVWPAGCFPMMLGTVAYSQAQICSILLQNPAGNGLVSLAHQLITAILNGCNGSTYPPAVAATIAAAHAQIGGLVVPPVGAGFLSPGSTSSKTETLDDYNNGLLGGVVSCPTAVESNTTWGRIKVLYR
jgi:hypothetical protein